MSATSPTAPAAAKPAKPSQKTPWVAFGVLAAAGLLEISLGAWEIGLVLFASGLLIAGFRLYAQRANNTVVIVNRSLDTITRGRLAEAEALLDSVEPKTRSGYLLRVIDVQRAIIAFRRGALAVAMQRADAALRRPLGLAARAQERVQVVSAQALRALLRASTGDISGAREDIVAVRRCPDVIPEALARAELAEAVVLERSGDREALREHITGSRTLLLEYTVPRERAIVRAYQRMLETKRATSAYREAAPQKPERAVSDEPTVADWMETIAPAAAPFARSRAVSPPAREATAPVSVEAVDPAARRAAEGRLAPRVGRRIGRFVALWALLTGVFLAVWQFMSADEQPAPHRHGHHTQAAALDLTWVWIPFTALIIGVFVARHVHAHKRAQKVLAALITMARGDEARGEAELRALAKSRYPLIAGRSWLELAAVAERRVAFAEALDACDRGIKVLSGNPAARAVAASTLLPGLVTQRAFVLAAMDRDAEAGAEMALLADNYPGFAYRGRAELRVGVLRRVRRGDLAGAADLIAQGTDDIPLSVRDEVLVDVVRAAVHPEAAGVGEIERLKRELRSEASLRAWIETVAPSALAAFAVAEQPREGDGDEVGDTEEAAGDAEAERDAEAEAEHEAHAALEVG